MQMKEIAIPAPRIIAECVAFLLVRKETKVKATGIRSAPTVFTSQMSVFGPVTSMKLSMSKRGHAAVAKIYAECEMTVTLNNFIELYKPGGSGSKQLTETNTRFEEFSRGFIPSDLKL